MAEVKKFVEPMFAEMRRFVTLENVTFQGLDNIPQQNRITKAERKLQMSFEAVLNKALHETVKKPSLGKFYMLSGGHTYEVENNQAYFEGYNFADPEEQTFVLDISAARDVNEHKGYMRFVIPISRNFWIHNLHSSAIQTERSLWLGLLIFPFDDGEVHVFTVTDVQDKQQYMVIEPQYEVTKETLFRIHYAVATGLGLITGTAYFGEAYLLVSSSLEFISFDAISYYSLRETVRSQYITFTTNMYWVEMLLKEGNYNRYALGMVTDENGEVKRGLVDWLYNETYGQIVYNMYKYPEFARAAIILIDGTDKALDYQAAMYAVALETLCTKLKEIYGMSFDGIINNDQGTWTRIRKPMTKIFRERCGMYEIDKLVEDRIANRIPNLNEISNNDKFNLVIERLGLRKMVSDDEAIRQRNNLLHGNLVDKTSDDSTNFDDMYYYSLVLHRLCTAILFKYGGYKGYLVNNAVLMDRKVACERREPVLIEI